MTVTEEKKLNALHQRLSRIRNTRVGDVMKRDVITLDANDLLATGRENPDRKQNSRRDRHERR
jgi:hypothetical protein